MSKVINYRNVYKSDHLGIIDLEEFAENGQKAILTIDKVVQYSGNNTIAVAGRKINCNIAYFKDAGIKPLVINATNGAVLRKFANSVDIQKWGGLVIELMVDKSVKMKGETVGGIRIKKQQPVITLDKLTKDHPQWSMAIERVKGGMTFDDINTHFTVTADTYKELQNV